jgi:hypothetical protein
MAAMPIVTAQPATAPRSELRRDPGSVHRRRLTHAQLT